MRLFLLFALLLAPLSAEAADIKYYYGKVTYATDNGRPPTYAVSLVKRTVSPELGRIDELVTEKKDKEEARDFPTALVRREKTNTFDLDMPGSFTTGSLTFQGDEWKWNKWTYDMSMTLPNDEANRKIDGDGGITSKGSIQSHKRIRFIQGSHTLLTIDRTELLEVISSERYDTLYRDIHAK